SDDEQQEPTQCNENAPALARPYPGESVREAEPHGNGSESDLRHRLQMVSEQQRGAGAEDDAEPSPPTQRLLEQRVDSDRPKPKGESMQCVKARPEEQLKAETRQAEEQCGNPSCCR